jgi:hypothetical protein
MPRQLDFEVGQTTLCVSRTKSANAFDDETVVLDWCLESLVAVPSHATSCIRYQWNAYVQDPFVLTSGVRSSS